MSGSALTASPPATVVNGFVNYQLGNLPSELCPDPNSPCQNFAAEPAIRADKFGNLFGSSENGLTAGTEAWKSIDGGLHNVHLPSPNQVSNSVFPISTAGGDTDLATASAKNSFGVYNVYIASLELTNVAVSTSNDGGHTWQTNDLAAHSIGVDREWIAADGASKVCITYRDLAGAQLHVDCSANAGLTFTQPGLAIDTSHLAFMSTNFRIGNLMIDQNSNTGDPARASDIVYQTFSGVDAADLLPCQTVLGPCHTHVVYMAVSKDGGKTFTDNVVFDNPNRLVDYGHQFVNVSVDTAGNVYSFFSDDHNLFFSFSRDQGSTWSSPVQVNRPPSNTAIFPWSAAGDAGKVDVVWYGSSFFDGVHTPDTYPFPTAQWFVYFAQNLNAFAAPGSWTQVQASPIVHLGGVCEGGVSCLGDQRANRDLFDDFGVAIRPSTGLASIIYSDDQFDQYNHVLTFPTSCQNQTTDNNTGNCDHTSIATQTTGSGITGGGGGGGGGGIGCHEADGNGTLKGSGTSPATVSMDEDPCEDHDAETVQAHDSGSGEDFHSTQIQSVAFDDVARTVTIAGSGVDAGRAVTFLLVAQDNGLLPSWVSLELSDGRALVGNLLTGSIQLH
jgi:hypothetical protein